MAKKTKKKAKLEFNIEPRDVVMWRNALKMNQHSIATFEHQIENLQMEIQIQKELTPFFEQKLIDAEKK